MSDLPQTMRALTLLHDGFGADPTGQALTDLSPYLAYRDDAAVPQPGPGEALVRVAAAAVNPSDVAYIKGIYGQPRRRGIAAGFEATGIVVAGDTPLIGRRVAFFGGGTGTWAEYALARADQLIPVMDSVSDDDAAGLIVNPLTAAAMFDLVRASGAQSFVATAAASQLGKYLISLGRDEGLACLAHIRRSEAAEALHALGAAEVLATDAPDYAKRLDAAMGLHGPTMLLDAVAGPASAEVFFAMPKGARWVIYGRLSDTPPTLTDAAQFIFASKRVEGFWLAEWMATAGQDTIEQVIALAQSRFASGAWRTDISARVPLAEAMDRLPALYGQKDSKVLLVP